MAISTTAELNALYNDIYEDSLLALREENLMVGGGLVTMYLNGRGYADRKVGVWSAASVAVKPEGDDFVTGTQYSKSLAATFTPQVRMAQFVLTDEMKQTDDVDNVRTRATDELASSIAEQIDVDMLTLFSGFSSVKGSANNPLTIAIVAAAQTKLRTNKARGQRNAVLHPAHWHDLWIELGQPVATKVLLGDVANQALMDFYVGDWMGMRFFISANIPVDGNADAYSAVITREALAYDQREAFALEAERDASRKAEELNASVGYAVGELRDAAGVAILSDATEPT